MNENLQYFSKLHKKWVDMKCTDDAKELKKFKYKIREKIAKDKEK